LAWTKARYDGARTNVIYNYSMKKSLSIVAIVLVVAVAGFLLWQGGVTPGTDGIPAGMLRYSSEEGVSFLYPDTYELSSRTDGNGERSWDVLVLLPKGYVPPQNGEGPPAISVSVFSNVEGYPLETWIKGDAKSNWKLAAPDATLKNTTVGGEPALAYRYSGLYETNAVAVARGGRLFLFEVGWLAPGDRIVRDFQNLLDTVEFTL